MYRPIHSAIIGGNSHFAFLAPALTGPRQGYRLQKTSFRILLGIFRILLGIYCHNIPTHTPQSGYDGVTEVAKTANIPKIHSLGHYWWKQSFRVFGTGCDRLSARLETAKNVLSYPSRHILSQHPHSHPLEWVPRGHRGCQNRQHTKNPFTGPLLVETVISRLWHGL